MQLKLPNGQYLVPSEPNVPPGPDSSISISEPCTFNEDQFVTDADWNISNKSRLTGRFFFADGTQTSTLTPGALHVGAVPGLSIPLTSNFRSFSLTHTYTFSSSLQNQVTIGYNRNYAAEVAPSTFTLPSIGANVPSNIAQYVGNNVEIDAGGFAIVPDLSGAGAQRFAQNVFEINDSISYVHGKHFFRFGGGVLYSQNNRGLLNSVPLIGFNTLADFLIGECAGSGPCPGATPYNGITVSGNGTRQGNIAIQEVPLGNQASYLRVRDINAYIQDDFKITPRLTLNLGFRYEHEGDPADIGGHNVGFDPGLITPYSTPCNNYTDSVGNMGCLLGYTVSSNYPGTPPIGVTKLGNEFGMNGNGQNTWNPRIGFAWRLPYTERFVLRGGYGIYHVYLAGQPQLLTTSGQPFTEIQRNRGRQASSLSWGAPIAPYPGAGFPSYTPYNANTTFTVQAFAPNYRPPIIQEYSLNLQTELTPNTMLEVGYSGSRGLHELTTPSPNQACAFGDSINPCPSSLSAAADPYPPNTLEDLQYRVPYQGFAALAVIQDASTAASWYNALLASLTHRFSHGLTLQASYTWAKELSTAANVAAGLNGGFLIGDQNHPLYGQEGFIRPQRLVVSWVYQLPGPHNLHSFLGETLGGWHVAGVTTYQSGSLNNIGADSLNNIYGDVATEAQLAPGCTAHQIDTPGSVQSKLNNYFNLSCIAFPAVSPLSGVEPAITIGSCGWQGPPQPQPSCAQSTGYGNIGLGNIKGPDQANWHISLGKHFPISWPNEKANIEFRADFFNAFNHPQFDGPNGTDLPPLPYAGVTASDPRVQPVLQRTQFGVITSTSVNPEDHSTRSALQFLMLGVPQGARHSAPASDYCKRL